MHTPLHRYVLAAAALCFTAACATTPPPPPMPALTFSGTAACSNAPDPSLAEAVTVKKRQTSGDVMKAIDAQTACVLVDGSKRPYALFRLPEGVAIQSVQAGGVFQRARVFAAEVVMLDADMKETRTFGPETLENRGGSMSSFFRAHDSEKYVLVRANPDLIGEGYFFTLREPNRAASGEVSKDYSYEGLVFARVLLSEPSAISPKAQ